jgi:protein gp37
MGAAGMTTTIEWTEETWNPVTGCDRISPGCDHCYALTMAGRLKAMGQPKYQRDGDPRTSGPGFGLTVHPDTLDAPLRWRKPRRVFVNSMSDLFHPEVPDEFVLAVWAVMEAAPQHTFQILTKRPQRMASLMSTPVLPATGAGPAYEVRPIPNFPGYSADTLGEIWSDRRGSFTRLSPDVGEQGHRRVTLRRYGTPVRVGVHRLVLSTFDRQPIAGEQGCHRDGDPSNNRLENLRWGSQQDNWGDRSAHGNDRSWSKLAADDVAKVRISALRGEPAESIARWAGVSATQVRNITTGRQWPIRQLPSVWLGTSIESDRYTFRADHLRNTPAAVRFLSLEPLLGPLPSLDLGGIDWVIVGGESGPGARRMAVVWARDIVAHCRDAGVPVFVKQLGTVTGGKVHHDIDTFPPGLQVREYPEGRG